VAAPIQTIPQGLLGLLQLKQLGTNPSNLVDTVQSTVDLKDWWMNRQEVDICLLKTGSSTASTNVNAAGVFGSTGLTVGTNEVWWVTNYTINCNLLAAEYIRFRPVFNFPAALSAVYTLGFDYNDVITARARNASAWAANFWLQPGAQLQFRVSDQATAANIAVAQAVRGVVIPI
jgi:hypothetical protein